VLQTGASPTTALVADASQNIGVGGVTPSAWTAFKAIEVGANGAGIAGGTGQPVMFCNATYNSGWKYTASNYACNYDQLNGVHRWFYAPSGTAGNAITFVEAMRIDTSGNLLVGTTTATGRTTVVAASGVAGAFQNPSAGNQTVDLWNYGASGTRYFMQFNTDAVYTARGYLTYNGSTVAIAQASDARLKENIVDAPSALQKISEMQIRSFDFKEDGRHVDYGVIAQELYEVLPSAVFEGNDNEDGTIDKPWSVGLEPIVPVLVKAIQELKAELDAAKADIATLKGAA